MRMHVRAAENVVFRTVGDELVLLDYERGQYYGLDPIGARVWELLASGASTDEVVNTLTAEYETTRDQLAADVARLVDELLASGLVVSM
jgi:hypothetical protein